MIAAAVRARTPAITHVDPTASITSAAARRGVVNVIPCAAMYDCWSDQSEILPFAATTNSPIRSRRATSGATPKRTLRLIFALI